MIPDNIAPIIRYSQTSSQLIFIQITHNLHDTIVGKGFNEGSSRISNGSISCGISMIGNIIIIVIIVIVAILIVVVVSMLFVICLNVNPYENKYHSNGVYNV